MSANATVIDNLGRAVFSSKLIMSGIRLAIASRLAPDMVFLFRRPILDYWCETGEDLKHVIRHVLIHEIGHHFGLSDEDMARIEAAAEG